MKLLSTTQAKVLHAMQKNRVAAPCFAATTGYGYDDVGRETLEKVYRDVFHTEGCLGAPPNHLRNPRTDCSPFCHLLPGDELLSPVGLPL